jgi:uncharacterized protein YbjT (DUF2867 family)
MMLVTGATGNIGTAVVAAARSANVRFRALMHSPDKAEALRQRGVDVAVGDMGRPESLRPALAGCSGLFLISQVSPALVELETTTLRAAREAGVTRVVKISALSVGTRFQAGLGDLHAAAEAALRQSGLEWTVLRPAATMGTPLAFGHVEGDVLRAPCSGGVAAYCAPEDIAELGVRMLDQGGHAGQVYSLTGPEALDLSRVAAIIAAETGRALRYEATSDEDYTRRLEALGTPKSVIALSISFFQRVCAGAFSDVLPTAAALLGRAGTSYAAWAKANATRWLRG